MDSGGAATVRPFRSGDAATVRGILERSLAAGEQPGTTRHDIDSMLLEIEVIPSRVLVATDGDRVVGFAAHDQSLVVVRPSERRRGHGTRLVAAALAAARAAGDAELGLASFGRPEAEVFLTRCGFAYHHSLWFLALPAEHTVAAPTLPPDVVLRDLRQDENLTMYVALINAAFADHPTQLTVEETLARHVHALPDFDPTLTAVATPRAEPEQPIALCRTSLVRDGETVVGDIRILGVLPEWRGRGLGRELLRWGVHRLRSGGATTITLTVEARNERALGLYERHGFERVQEWPQWTKAVEECR